MPWKIDPIDPLIFYLLVLGFLSILTYVVVIKLKERRHKRKVTAISITIIEYFRNSGVEVTTGCVSLQGNQRFTAFIESEPMKRFRLSHIIETTLIDHVRKSCGVELVRVYWRFPIKKVKHDPVDGDAYINEGLVPYKYLPKVEVTEIPWEKFEEVSTLDDEKASAPDTGKK